MSNDRVIIERDGHIAHVQMNRPDKKNAIDTAMFTQLREAARELGADRSVWAIVLSGAGHTFCSGLDTANFARMASGAVKGDSVPLTQSDLSEEGATTPQQTAWLWHEMATPVVAAVEGHALGAGFHLALAADLRVVAPSAKIGFVEITWGLVPDLSGTQGLRRLVSLDVAKRLVYTGEIISGSEAFDLGLATYLDEQPIERAFEIAGAITKRNPDALRAAKRVLNQAQIVSVREGLANEMKAASSLVGAPNQIEAIKARFEARDPEFANPGD